MNPTSMLWLVAVAGLLLTAGPVSAEEARDKARALGEELFAEHCASCHGSDGKGGGPAAAALKKTPKDLTAIAERSGGTFPRLTVEEIIDGQRFMIAHGSRTMPIWGDVFAREGGTRRAETNVFAIAEYLESIQAK